MIVIFRLISKCLKSDFNFLNFAIKDEKLQFHPLSNESRVHWPPYLPVSNLPHFRTCTVFLRKTWSIASRSECCSEGSRRPCCTSRRWAGGRPCRDWSLLLGPVWYLMKCLKLMFHQNMSLITRSKNGW